MLKREKGFTLIELMIVVAIIGILAAIAIPRFAQLIDKAREAGARGNLGALRSAVAIFYGDNHGVWPNSLISTENWTLTNSPETYPGFIPNYMQKIPKATLQRGNIHNDKPDVLVVETGVNEQLTTGKITDVGGWVYSSNSGDVRISCKCKDTRKLTIGDGSTLYYSNYGHEE